MVSSKRILVAVENQQEAANLIPIVSRLNNEKNLKVLPTFLSLDNVYFQNVESLLQNEGLEYQRLQLSYSVKRSIYFYPRYTQLWFSLSNYGTFREVVDGFDGFLCGIAGIAQRSLAVEAKKQRKLNFQVLTGRMSPFIANSRRNRAILSLFKAFPLSSYLFPGGYLAGSTLMDHIFCLGESDYQLLKSMDLDGEIHNFGVPGFNYLFSENRSPKPSLNQNEVRRLLYLTGSFSWHRSSKDAYQKEALLELADLVQYLGPPYRLMVKVHPRENLEDYAWLTGYKCVDIVMGKIDEAIEQAYIVISIVSTGLLEAIKKNKIAISLMTGFPENDIFWDLSREISFIPSLRNGKDLAIFLEEIDSPQNYDTLLQRQKEGVDFFISPSTPSSAENISQLIIEELSRV